MISAFAANSAAVTARCVSTPRRSSMRSSRFSASDRCASTRAMFLLTVLLVSVSILVSHFVSVGGWCFGYGSKEVREGDRRSHAEDVVNEVQADIVREIFERYAGGDGLRTIAKALNARRIPSPQAGKRGTGSWSQSAVRSMLRNERYLGRPIWNRTQKTYKGGTKVRIPRPKCDWIQVELPELRIILR